MRFGRPASSATAADISKLRISTACGKRAVNVTRRSRDNATGCCLQPANGTVPQSQAIDRRIPALLVSAERKPDAPIRCIYSVRRFVNFSCQQSVPRSSCNSDSAFQVPGAPRPALPIRQETALDSAPRSPNGFLSSLTADDFELVRPYLRTVELPQELVLVEVDELLKRAYLPHRGVISLVVKLARGENVQIAMVGRDSIFGSFSALGDATALNSAVVLVPGMASTVDIDQLRAAADHSLTFHTTLARHGLAAHAPSQPTARRHPP